MLNFFAMQDTTDHIDPYDTHTDQQNKKQNISPKNNNKQPTQ